jgi:hypothetical protein
MPEYDSGEGGAFANSRPWQSGDSALPWWAHSIVLLGVLLLSTGALVALLHPVLLVPAHDQMSEAVHIYAGYFASRNLGLALIILTAMGLRAKGPMNTLMLLTALIQVLDAGMDLAEGRWVIVPGVVVLAALFFAASFGVSGYPFWKLQAWK